MIDTEPELLLFPEKKPSAKKDTESKVQEEDKMQVAIVQPKKQEKEETSLAVVEDSTKEMLRFRNPHLLEPSTFNVQDKSYYYH